MSVARIKGAVLRDTVQWLVGLGIALNETIVRTEAPRWEVLIFSGILMGIPALIGMLNLKQEAGGQAPQTTVDSPSTSQPSA